MAVAVDEKEESELFGCEGMEITEATAEKMTRLAEKRANEIENLAKTLGDANKNKDESAELLIKSIEECVKYKHGASKQVLSTLKELVGESVESYKSFREMLKNDENLSKYPDRVKGAQTVYATYWNLLIETGPMLSVLVSKIKTVIDTITEYKEDSQDSIEDESDVDTLIDGIGDCINALSEWQQQAHKIDGFSVKWGNLAQLAQNEEREWRTIYNARKKELKEKMNVWQNFLSGIRSIREYASEAFAAAGNFTFEDIARGIIRTPALLTVWPAAVGYGIYKAYSNYKDAKKGFKAAEKTARNIEYVLEVMLNVGKDAHRISDSLSRLQEDMNKDLTSSFKGAERNAKNLKNDYTKGKSKRLKRKIDKINQSFEIILTSMESFKTDCQGCIKIIQDSRKNIIDLQKKHFGK